MGFWETWAVEDDGYSRGREERENVGITYYVNERGWLKRARENKTQLTMATSGHINITLQLLKAFMIRVGGVNTHIYIWSELTREGGEMKLVEQTQAVPFKVCLK